MATVGRPSVKNGLQRDLIFDIGVNHGEDTEFYLAKGFRVVGVEADPVLGAEILDTFRSAIASGQLHFENVGLSNRAGSLPFYRNLEWDHWSSFERTLGARYASPCEVVIVTCLTILDLLMRHGCPYYMKIDIEGANHVVLNDLAETSFRPQFISSSELSAEAIEVLFRMGYNMFSLRPQSDKSWAVPPNPALEGKYVDRTFTRRDSGLFGLEVRDWMSRETINRLIGEGGRPVDEWYDIHATHWPTIVNDRSLRRWSELERA